MYVKLLYVKLLYVKLFYVKFVCVEEDEEEEAEEEQEAEEPGIQNQKQEPHTKMWGTMQMRLLYNPTWLGKNNTFQLHKSRYRFK